MCKTEDLVLHSSMETFFLNFLSCSCDSCLALLARDSGATGCLEFFICCGDEFVMFILALGCCFKLELLVLLITAFVVFESLPDTLEIFLTFSMLDLLLGGEQDFLSISTVTEILLSISCFFLFLLSSQLLNIFS